MLFSFQGISTYHQQLSLEQTTCVEAVSFYLQNIKIHSALNAFVEVYEQEALQKAAQLDAQRQNGQPLKKLHGVVIAIKDVICYKDHSVSAASAMLKGFRSLYTATALQYLIDEDAIIIGNCNCDEFAMGSSNENSVYGPVLNALNETKVSGGSSGGSAVAVQADMCMLSLGSDTGGSVRQPADYCGIIGMKPGYGQISRYGLIAYASSFDQIGIFGKHVEDIARLLDIMNSPDARDSTMLQTKPAAILPELKDAPQKKFKFCYLPDTLEHPSLDPEIREKIMLLIQQLQATGHTVQAAEFDLLDYVVPAYYVLTTAEASSNLSRYDGLRYGHNSPKKPASPDEYYKNNRSEGFGAEVKKRIMLGSFVLSSGYYDAYYNKAQQVRRMLVDRMAAIFSDYDAILLPTSPTTAPLVGEKNNNSLSVYLSDIYTVFANLTGIPAISIPVFSHSNNMPFGIQVMTNKLDEVTLLQIAKLFMQQYRNS